MTTEPFLWISGLKMSLNFFDYVYRDSRKNPVRYYYDRMGGSGTGLDYAEKLLICLAKDYANRSDITAEWNVSLH